MSDTTGWDLVRREEIYARYAEKQGKRAADLSEEEMAKAWDEALQEIVREALNAD